MAETIAAEVKQLRADLDAYQSKFLASLASDIQSILEPEEDEAEDWPEERRSQELAAEMRSLKARVARLEALAAEEQQENG